MSVHETIVNQALANLDLSKVAALQQKRTLAFVNHFVLTTVQFLNNFMKNCEHKMMHFERKLERIDAAMVLLEARLSSIPEVSSITSTESQNNDKIEERTENADKEGSNESEKLNESTEDQNSVETHTEYDRFIKMVQVGVPLEAVKLKVSLEGLDPDVFVSIVNK